MEKESTSSCSICFEDFAGKETAKPDVCDHMFCLQCLQKWGKFGSFCPIDRRRFRKIVNLSTSIEIPIKPKKRKKDRALYDVSSFCEVCRKVRDNDTLLLCDCCDLAYHLTCLKPPLSDVPPGVWNCPECDVIGEKLKSRKGIPKGHPSSGLSSSSGSSSNLSKPKTLTKEKTRKVSNIEHLPTKRKYVRRTNFFQNKKARTMASNEDKLRSLRPRTQVDKRFFESSDSSEESHSMTSTDSVTSRKSEDTRIKSLRPRNLLKRGLLCDNSNDSSDCSQGYSNFNDCEEFSEKSTSNTEYPSDIIATSGSAGETNRSDFLPESHPVVFSTDRSTPEASVVSPETQSCATNDLVESSVCIITSTCSLEECDDKTVSVTDNVEVKADDGLPSNSNKQSSCISEDFEGDDEITVVATVVKERSPYASSSSSKFGDVPNFSKTLASEISSDDELPELLPFDAVINQLNQQNASNSEILSRHKVKPVFNVFEKLEDENLATQKYSELKKAVKISPPLQKGSTVLVKKEMHNSFKMCSKNATKFNTVDLKANTLSKELRSIEKEKWNTHHYKSRVHKCCKRYGKNQYKSSDVVHIGKHYCQKKYTDNYKELASISKSLNLKRKWGEKDIVILNNLKTNVQTCSKEVVSPNRLYSSIHSQPTSSSKASKIEVNRNHEIISLNNDSLKGFMKAQAKLLRATLCLSNLKHLDVQKDGRICLNWQK